MDWEIELVCKCPNRNYISMSEGVAVEKAFLVWYGLLPSDITLFPLPVGLLGLTTTSMERIRSVLRLCSSCRACKDSQLNLSEPQNRILRGSDALAGVL
jgi:hypothetical protein